MLLGARRNLGLVFGRTQQITFFCGRLGQGHGCGASQDKKQKAAQAAVRLCRLKVALALQRFACASAESRRGSGVVGKTANSVKRPS